MLHPWHRPRMRRTFMDPQASHTVSVKAPVNKLWFVSGLVCPFVRPVSSSYGAIWSCRFSRSLKLTRFLFYRSTIFKRGNGFHSDLGLSGLSICPSVCLKERKMVSFFPWPCLVFLSVSGCLKREIGFPFDLGLSSLSISRHLSSPCCSSTCDRFPPI